MAKAHLLKSEEMKLLSGQFKISNSWYWAWSWRLYGRSTVPVLNSKI
jgi:hypothetical protein